MTPKRLLGKMLKQPDPLGALMKAGERVAEARRSAASCSPRVLAEKIARRLFVNGFGDEGTRLDIRKSVEMVEHSLGGWCFQAAVDQIAEILQENVNMEAPNA